MGGPHDHREPVTLLWTGGWDSTFRLLYLLLVRSRAVRPYYLIDSDRLSTRHELLTMKRIRARLAAKSPDAAELLLPVVFEEISTIPPQPEITAAFQRLRAATALGSQYDWLARFAHARDLKSLEMGIVQSNGRASRMLCTAVVATDEDGERQYEVDPKAAGSDVFTVFKYFRFPVIDLSKPDMDRIAREHGFDQLLELSWFCHSPRRNGSPCGVCNPCICTIEEGMGRRLPALSRARYYGHRWLKASRNGARNALGRFVSKR